MDHTNLIIILIVILEGFVLNSISFFKPPPAYTYKIKILKELLDKSKLSFDVKKNIFYDRQFQIYAFKRELDMTLTGQEKDIWLELINNYNIKLDEKVYYLKKLKTKQKYIVREFSNGVYYKVNKYFNIINIVNQDKCINNLEDEIKDFFNTQLKNNINNLNNIESISNYKLLNPFELIYLIFKRYIFITSIIGYINIRQKKDFLFCNNITIITIILHSIRFVIIKGSINKFNNSWFRRFKYFTILKTICGLITNNFE